MSQTGPGQPGASRTQSPSQLEGPAYCQWLSKVESGQESWWGKEAVALNAAARFGASVPPAFVVSTVAHREYFTSTKVLAALKQACKGLSPDKPQHFAGVAQDIRRIVRAHALPKPLEVQLADRLTELRTLLLHTPSRGIRLRLLASSDSGESYALSRVISTHQELSKALKALYALAFTDHAVFTRVRDSRPIVPSKFAVLTQFLEAVDTTGIAACYDPVAHDGKTIWIRASHYDRPSHLERLTEDTYRVDRKSLLLLSKEVSGQWWSASDEGFVSPAHQGKSGHVLTDAQIIQLARQLSLAQKSFPDPVRFDWAYAHRQFMITRVVELPSSWFTLAADRPAPQLSPLLTGLPGSLGWASGQVRLIRSKTDRKKLQDGEIAVVEQLQEDDYDWLAGVAGLITDTGHRVSWEARLGQQMAVPSVIATKNATTQLTDGQVVTLDGVTGTVYSGKQKPTVLPAQPLADTQLITGTKLYATVSDPYLTDLALLSQAEGIGVLRSEFLLHTLGVHPKDILRHGKAGEYAELLRESIEPLLKAVYPKPVLYQLHDLGSMGMLSRSHRNEPNPALGYRGTHRLLAEPELLELELSALLHLAKAGIDNFSLLLPMVRSLSELRQVREQLEASPLAKQVSLKLWVKCETPALLILADELALEDIAGVCFDVPSLTQFILGIDKENRQMAHHANPAESAVVQALAYAIKACRGGGIATEVSAELEPMRPEVVQVAIEAGVTAVSVAPEALESTRHLVAAIEQRLVLNHLLAEA